MITERLALEIIVQHTRGLNQHQIDHIAFIMVHDQMCLFDVMDLESNEINKLKFKAD